MKVAVFGNNLNAGLTLVRALRRAGAYGDLFSMPYSYAQESPEWWSKSFSPADAGRVFPRVDLSLRNPLSSIREIGELYGAVSEYDVLVMMEDGPAYFSELRGVPKVFLAAGGDIQIIPFLREVVGPDLQALGASLGRALSDGNWRDVLRTLPNWMAVRSANARIEQRQRAGILQCHACILSPHQGPLATRLGIQPLRVRHVPFLMDTEVLDEIDTGFAEELRRTYSGLDLLFFHPTRQFYLPLNNDRYLKDNDKLIRGYAEFVRTNPRSSRLLLVEKGRAPDLARTRELIAEAGIQDRVDWMPELPNRKMRAYYALPQCVVCDQFSPNLAMLGNVGREASFFGRPLITAFSSMNSLYYGQDMPEHVFAAQSATEVKAAMARLASLDATALRDLEARSRAWFLRNHDGTRLIHKYLAVFRDLASASSPS